MSEESDDFALDINLSDEENIAQNLQKTCINLLARNEFVDCTLSCSDGQLQAHKIVLSSVSQYLHNLFSATPWPTPCSHPVILLRNSNRSDVQLVLECIYTGKMNTTKNRIPALMVVIRELGVSSIEKAVKCAIQSCGVEMFRRLSNSNNNNNTTSTTTSKNNRDNTNVNVNTNTTSSSAGKFDQSTRPNSGLTTTNNDIVANNNEATIKSEPIDDTNLIDHNDVSILGSMNESDNLCLAINNSASFPHGGEQQVGPGSSNNSLATWMGDNRNVNGSNKSSSYSKGRAGNSILLQLDKCENFVYTNEDLGMLTLDQMENEGSDDQQPDNNHDMEDEDDATSNMIAKTTSQMEGDETEFPGGDLSANVCPWCMQVFTNLTLLQRHIKNHLGGQKQFACHYCNNTFARSAHLKRHLRTHTGEKPYSCSVCDRAFARQDKLKVHLERHLANSNKPANNSMTITSYPPQQANSQQVPIKILIPAGSLNNPHLQQQQQTQQNRKGNNTFASSTALNNLMITESGSSSSSCSSTSVKISSTNNINNNSNNNSNTITGPATITPIMTLTNSGSNNSFLTRKNR